MPSRAYSDERRSREERRRSAAWNEPPSIILDEANVRSPLWDSGRCKEKPKSEVGCPSHQKGAGPLNEQIQRNRIDWFRETPFRILKTIPENLSMKPIDANAGDATGNASEDGRAALGLKPLEVTAQRLDLGLKRGKSRLCGHDGVLASECKCTLMTDATQ